MVSFNLSTHTSCSPCFGVYKQVFLCLFYFKFLLSNLLSTSYFPSTAILAELSQPLGPRYFLLWVFYYSRKWNDRHGAPKYQCARLSFPASHVVKLGPCNQFWWVDCEKQEISISAQNSLSPPSLYFPIMTTSGLMCTRWCHYKMEASPHGPHWTLCRQGISLGWAGPQKLGSDLLWPLVLFMASHIPS